MNEHPQHEPDEDEEEGLDEAPPGVENAPLDTATEEDDEGQDIETLRSQANGSEGE